MSFQYFNKSNILSTNALNTSYYRHVALTISGSTHTLYLDGSVVATNTNALNIFNYYPSTISNLLIGSTADLSYGFSGYIDDFKVFNRALPVSDISRIYNSLPAPSVPSNLTLIGTTHYSVGISFSMTALTNNIKYSVILSPTATATVTGNNSMLNISGLTVNTTYNLNIVASNSAGSSTSSTFSFTTSKLPLLTYINSLNAIIYIPFNTNVNNILSGSSTTIIGNPSLSYTTIGGFNCTYITTTSYSSFLTININNPTILTFTYWVYHVSGNNTNSPACITNTTNLNSSNVSSSKFTTLAVTYANNSNFYTYTLWSSSSNSYTSTYAYSPITTPPSKWIFVAITISTISPYLTQRYVYTPSGLSYNIQQQSDNGTPPFTAQNSFVFGINDVGTTSNMYMRHFFAFNSILTSSQITEIYNYTVNL